jgi:hypothetical protein
VPQVGTDGDSSRGGAAVEVEQGTTEGRPARFMPVRRGQNPGHASSSSSTGPSTRITGSSPTVSSQ